MRHSGILYVRSKRISSILSERRDVVLKTKKRYTADYFLDVMRNYRMYVETLLQQDELLPSVGVSQYGDESSMPRSGGVTSTVERAAIGLADNPFFKRRAESLDRFDRALSLVQHDSSLLDIHFAVVDIRMRGFRTEDISEITGLSQRTVQRKLRDVAECMSDKYKYVIEVEQR